MPINACYKFYCRDEKAVEYRTRELQGMSIILFRVLRSKNQNIKNKASIMKYPRITVKMKEHLETNHSKWQDLQH